MKREVYFSLTRSAVVFLLRIIITVYATNIDQLLLLTSAMLNRSLLFNLVTVEGHMKYSLFYISLVLIRALLGSCPIETSFSSSKTDLFLNFSSYLVVRLWQQQSAEASIRIRCRLTLYISLCTGGYPEPSVCFFTFSAGVYALPIRHRTSYSVNRHHSGKYSVLAL